MTDSEPSLRQLERDAERNRADLMHSVDALQRRMSPSAIKHDVQEYVRDKKDSFLHSLEQKARDNPLQAVAIAAGAFYPLWGVVSRVPVPLLLIGAGFALSRRWPENQGPGDSSSFAQSASERLNRTADAVRERAVEVSDAVQDRLKAGKELADRAGHHLSQYSSQAADAASKVAIGVAQTASKGAESLRDASSDAVSVASQMLSPQSMRRAGTQANDWVNDTVGRNPLIVGALGIAVGAIIAASLPSTIQEDKLLGPVADNLKQKATDAALEGVTAAKEITTEIYQEAASRAKDEGLSVDDAKEFAGKVGERVKTAVANTTGTDQQPRDQENSPHTTSGATG